MRFHITSYVHEKAATAIKTLQLFPNLNILPLSVYVCVCFFWRLPHSWLYICTIINIQFEFSISENELLY